MTGDHIQIIWQGEASTVCGSVTYYVRLTVTANEQLITQDTTSNTFYEFTGLSPNTFYNASVYGSNQAGDGDATSLNIQTRRMFSNIYRKTGYFTGANHQETMVFASEKILQG